ncbi:MAG: response regulator [Cyclobacteriaceae bacterium]|jgi:CheY-like chemotaxis protein
MKKILVIEDDANIRESLVELLEMKSYTLLSADNGTDGLKLAQEQIPDLILCDVMMPGMNGYEVVEAIRKDSRLAKLPFIFLSAKAMDSDVEYGKNLGANSYLTKPFRAQDLFSVVDDLLDDNSGGNFGTGKILDQIEMVIAEIALSLRLRWRLV